MIPKSVSRRRFLQHGTLVGSLPLAGCGGSNPKTTDRSPSDDRTTDHGSSDSETTHHGLNRSEVTPDGIAGIIELSKNVAVVSASVRWNKVRVGQTAGVSASLDNDGAEAETVSLELGVDGDVVASEDVVIAAGTKKYTEIVAKMSEPGDHKLSLNGHSVDVVTVNGKATSD